MNTGHQTGKKGEHIAVKCLKEQGYRIIEKNFNCCFGEIDIICKNKNELVFVEVKTRCNRKYGEPRDAIDNIKQKHIYKSAEYYITRKKNY